MASTAGGVHESLYTESEIQLRPLPAPRVLRPGRRRGIGGFLSGKKQVSKTELQLLAFWLSLKAEASSYTPADFL